MGVNKGCFGHVQSQASDSDSFKHCKQNATSEKWKVVKICWFIICSKPRRGSYTVLHSSSRVPESNSVGLTHTCIYCQKSDHIWRTNNLNRNATEKLQTEIKILSNAGLAGLKLGFEQPSLVLLSLSAVTWNYKSFCGPFWLVAKITNFIYFLSYKDGFTRSLLNNNISVLCRMFTTLFVSAFWHGVAPGYYLTFLCVPLVVIAEVQMEKAIKPYLSPKLCYYYDWLSWFFHYRSMEYLGCGFMLLQLAPCWAAWKSVYFIGHIILLAFIIIPFFIPKKHTSDKEAKKKLSWLQLWLDIVSFQNI